MTIIADTAEYTITETITPNGKTVTLVNKPGSPGDNQEKIIAKLTAALDTLETADATWATLTTAQKIAAAQFAVRVSAKLIRLTLGRLEAN